MESFDPQVRRTMAQARIAAPCDASLLIRGEKGTGKRTLARAIHAWSKRSAGPFVTVSCPSLSPELLGSELFGHVRAAFPAALGDCAGKIAAAEGGTLFLGEVGALPAELQPRLLRLIQDQQYQRVGEAVTRSADVRVVAATSHDLEAAVASGAFRQELLYRLSVIELTLPPLRLRCDLWPWPTTFWRASPARLELVSRASRRRHAKPWLNIPGLGIFASFAMRSNVSRSWARGLK